jgi:ligand-binding sensor domain-containing protein/signal transduction histidine kinase/DNA-binding response OmpR family regulator
MHRIQSKLYSFNLYFGFFVLFLLCANPILLYGKITGSLFDNYTVNEGLNDKTIHCIFQDSKGWIWIGTDFGLLKFDGYNFKKFTIGSDQSKVMENALIRTIFEDNDGIIWIGTENHGLFRYDRRFYEIKQFDGPIFSNSSIWSIVEDKKNNLWIGTENGLNYFNTKSFKSEIILNSQNSPGKLPGDFIRKLYLDTRNRLWIGTENGIAILNPNRSIEKKLLTDIPVEDKLENEVWSIFQDSNGDVWIGTYLGGVFKCNSQNGDIQKICLDKKNPRAVTVRSILQDKNGNVWIGTRGGLYSIEKNTQKVSHFAKDALNDFSLIHNSVLCLSIDLKGDLWVGTRHGISFMNFNRQAFGYLTSIVNNTESLNNSEVYALWEDENKNIWIGTENGGINIYDRKNNKISFITTNNGLSNNCIKAICPDSKGNILIGTYLGGLNQFNPKTGQNKIYRHHSKNINSISDNSVWSILTDSKGRIWVGTTKGVDLFNDIEGTFEPFGEEFEVSGVSYIYEDPEGRLWMYSGDMKRLTMITPGGSVRHFPYKTQAISGDDKGYIWISTMGNGLLRYDPMKNKVVDFTKEDGLCSNVIYGMINVNNRYLWLSTNNGLSRFEIETKEFKNYNTSNGLLNNQFNYCATLHCAENMLAFGGIKGIDFVYLSELKENNYKPPVFLTDFKIFNKSIQVYPDSSEKYVLQNFISETDRITLPFDKNMITFEFAALNYANSDQNTYRYKLEGFDNEWNNIATNRIATYTNLDPGEYVFKVIGTNNDNLSEPEGLSLELVIEPPFWKTWFFRVLVVSFIVLLYYPISRFIVNRETLKHQLYYERQTARKVQELERLKHQFFTNISHEIRTPLSLIIGPLNKLINTQLSREVMLSYLNIIKRNTTILNKLVNQLLDYRKLEGGNLKLDLKQGNLGLFIEELIEQFKPLAKDKSIDLGYSNSHKSIFAAFDTDKLEKILNNLISNALKFTKSGGKVSVSLALLFLDDLEDPDNFLPPVDMEGNTIKQFVRIIVKDTGIGIPSSEIMKIFDRFKQIENSEVKSSGSGIGLSLTKELVSSHKGHIQVKSKVGKGSRFTLLIPYIQDDKNKLNEKNSMQHFLQENNIANQILFEETKADKKPILLIADDNPDIRQFVKHHFEPDYKVLESKDGKEGWIKALEQVPDIVIADVMMSQIDGIELCRKIKNDERTSHIPIFMLTALSDNEKQLAGIAAGADDYIIKPFDVSLLKAKSDNILYLRKILRERYSKELLLKPKDIVLTSPDEKFLKRVIQVIEKNIGQSTLDVDFLAKEVGVSRTQLYRKINALTDMAAKEFVKDIRLKRAAQLILQNKLTISEIAYKVGFNDTSYFRKCFRGKYGMSASRYIKQA